MLLKISTYKVLSVQTFSVASPTKAKKNVNYNSSQVYQTVIVADYNKNQPNQRNLIHKVAFIFLNYEIFQIVNGFASSASKRNPLYMVPLERRENQSSQY